MLLCENNRSGGAKDRYLPETSVLLDPEISGKKTDDQFYFGEMKCKWFYRREQSAGRQIVLQDRPVSAATASGTHMLGFPLNHERYQRR